MTRCAILGASGHGKVIAELAILNNYNEIFFYDDKWPSIDKVEYWPVVGNTNTLLKDAYKYDLIVVAIGHNATRQNLYQKLLNINSKIPPLVHPSAVISQYSKIGLGTVIMAGAVINPFCRIGQFCIINTSASIDHDCTISDGVHISPGSHLAGSINIGQTSWVGIGSCIKQQVTIGENVIIAAGATVVNNILNNQTVAGTPAKQINLKDN